MADLTTQIADILAVENEFLATVNQAIADKSVYRQAGLIVDDAAMSEVANGALGATYNKRFFKPLAQTESHVPNDNPADRGQSGKITMGVSKVRAHERANGWSSMDLTAEVLDADPMGAIANRVAEYWDFDERASVIAIMQSLMTQPGFEHVIDGVLDLDGIIDACALKGDFYESIEGLIVPKPVHTLLQKAEGNLFVPKSQTNIGFDTFGGLKLVVNSAIAPVGGVYTSIAFGRGAFASATGTAKKPVAYVRDELAGNFGAQETLINRRKFVLHPKGFSYEGTTAEMASATNAELATAGAFVASDDAKLIPLVFIKSKLA